MANRKADHHRGTHHRRSKQVRDAAYANPDTRCWSCNRTLQQIRVLKPGARWTAGHVIDGQVDGLLLAECSSCNFSRGAAMGNAKRKRTDLTW